MKYALVGNHAESTLEKNTRRLFELLDIPLEQSMIAPDSLQKGLFPSMCYREQWVSAWVDFFQKAQKNGVMPIFIEEGSYISGLLALNALKKEQTHNIHQLGEHLLLSSFLASYAPTLEQKIQKSWKGFRGVICDSAFTLLRNVIEGASYREAQLNIIKYTDIQILAQDTCFEAVPHLVHFNPEIAIKENARVYYEMVDRGVDCILTFSLNAYRFYEQYAEQIKKYSGRDMLDVPVLHLSEVLLLSLGQNIATHKIPFKVL